MEKKNVAEKVGRREWILIWVVGLAGQLCWNVENHYLCKNRALFRNHQLDDSSFFYRNHI